MNKQSRNTIQSIEKIPFILNLFKTNKKLTLHEIHKHSGFTKSSAHRMCNSLVNIGFLKKEGIGKTPYYRLGVELYRLGSLSIESFDIQLYANKYLINIATELQDNAYLFIAEKEHALCLNKEEGNFHIRTNTTKIGDLIPYNLGGSPQAILAFLDEDRYEDAITSLNMSNLEKVKLEEKIQIIRSRGYAISLEEFAQGTGAIGVPVFDITNKVVGALSVGGILSRFSEERLPQIVKTLKESAKNLSRELGYIGQINND